MSHHMITRSKKSMITRSMMTAKNSSSPVGLQVGSCREKRVIRRKKRRDHNSSTCKKEGEGALPIELMAEVFSWLPVEELLKIKCVCKAWYNLIQDRYFIRKHLKRSKFCRMRMDQPKENEEAFEHVGNKAGLVLERGRTSDTYRVRNPAVRQVFYVPRPHERYRLITISFARNSGYFKLVSVYYGVSNDDGGGIEVLTLGTEEKPTWRRPIESFFFQSSRGDDVFMFAKQSGVIHFVKSCNIALKDYEVMSFDLDSESLCGYSTVPRSVFPHGNNVWLLKCDKGLFLIDIVDDEFQMLGFRDYKKGKWDEEKRVIPLPFLKEFPEMEETIEPCSSFSLQLQTIWFIVNDEIELTYSIKEQRIVRRTVIGQNGEQELYVSRPSLVTFRGMRPFE